MELNGNKKKDNNNNSNKINFGTDSILDCDIHYTHI